MTDRSALIREKATDAHKAVAREIATALATGHEDPGRDDAWLRVIAAFGQHLTWGEAMMLAHCGLRAVHPDDLRTVLEASLPTPPEGSPPVPMMWEREEVLRDAATWADCATPYELRAYAMACLARIPREERRAMLAHLAEAP